MSKKGYLEDQASAECERSGVRGPEYAAAMSNFVLTQSIFSLNTKVSTFEAVDGNPSLTTARLQRRPHGAAVVVMASAKGPTFEDLNMNPELTTTVANTLHRTRPSLTSFWGQSE